jgi:phosphohistidine phosphatase
MILYFMRHAEAEETSPEGDAGRKLTPKGLQRAQDAGRALAALEVTVDLVLTSPLARALETADAVLEALEAEVALADDLAGKLNVATLKGMVEERVAARVMLVGHEPDMSRTIEELIGGGRVEMKKGAVACVEMVGIAPGSGVLRWLLTGKQLEYVARAL